MHRCERFLVDAEAARFHGSPGMLRYDTHRFASHEAGLVFMARVITLRLDGADHAALAKQPISFVRVRLPWRACSCTLDSPGTSP